MRRVQLAGAAVIVAMCSMLHLAEWPKYPAPGVPRDADGKVAMDAPAPCTPDGQAGLVRQLGPVQGRRGVHAPGTRRPDAQPGGCRADARSSPRRPWIPTRRRSPPSGRLARTWPVDCRSRRGPRT